MKVFGIGVDVVEVERIARAIRDGGEKFTGRVFTAAERAYCEAQARPELHFAARFAAKEAVAKALGTGIGGNLGWLDAEVVRGEEGAPRLVLSGAGAEFAERNGIHEVLISLSHAQAYAAANALALAGTDL